MTNPRSRGHRLWRFSMSERRKTASRQSNTPALIVANNLDFPVRYAAWFTSRGVKAAKTAANDAQFHVVTIETAEAQELAARLTEGSIESGSLQLAQIDEALAHELDTLILAAQTIEAEAAATQMTQATPEGGDSSASEAAPAEAVLDAWEALKPGMLVLAADLDRQGKPEAWYEAQIMSLEGPEIRLLWRDFPREGLLLRTRRHIAILPPANN
ncbi:hypothetical protein [Methylovirgula ligni]|nr:hypothetical protein [Methylovirgula ligni]